MVRVFKILTGKKPLPTEFLTPMEEAKHSSVDDLDKILYEKYEVLLYMRQNAFIGLPATYLRGPDIVRYSAARVLVALDKLFCRFGITKGFDRKIIARKRA
mgnify:CR=1 FL=1